MPHPIEPGLLRIFRYYTIVSLCYFTLLILYTGFQTRQGFGAVQIQWYLNFVNDLALFIYLSWPGLQQRLRSVYLPLALCLAAGMPILSNLIFLAPRVNNLVLSIEPNWLLFPTTFVALVLIAWHYSFAAVLAFTILSAVVELGVLYPLVGKIDIQTLPILAVPLVRAFAYGIVGHIITRLMSLQRAQHRELVRANLILSQHAATLEQLTVSRERNRLARDLHDTLAHTLSGQAINLEAIKLVLPPDQVEAQAMLDQTLKITRDGLAEVRLALKDLRSRTLEDLGPSIAIRNLVLEAAARADFGLDLEVADDLPRLSPEVEQAIYRITQESFANIVRHANAQRVRLRLGVKDGQLSLTITDDGKGVDLKQVDFENQLGLLGMQERAAMVGGKFSMDSQPDCGTTIRFTLEAYGD